MGPLHNLGRVLFLAFMWYISFLSVAVQVYKMQYHQQGEKRAVGVLIPALQKISTKSTTPQTKPSGMKITQYKPLLR